MQHWQKVLDLQLCRSNTFSFHPPHPDTSASFSQTAWLGTISWLKPNTCTEDNRRDKNKQTEISHIRVAVFSSSQADIPLGKGRGNTNPLHPAFEDADNLLLLKSGTKQANSASMLEFLGAPSPGALNRAQHLCVRLASDTNVQGQQPQLNYWCGIQNSGSASTVTIGIKQHFLSVLTTTVHSPCQNSSSSRTPIFPWQDI